MAEDYGPIGKHSRTQLEQLESGSALRRKGARELREWQTKGRARAKKEREAAAAAKKREDDYMRDASKKKALSNASSNYRKSTRK